VTVATPGTGSAAHLTLELVSAQAGVRMTHVPYRGGSALVPDLIAGTVDASFVELPNVLPLHRDGQARIVGVAALARSTVLSDVETFAEAGMPGFTAGSFGGLLAPAATPDAVIARLHQALAESIAAPTVAERVIQVGAVPATPEQATPEGFARFLAAELAAARRAVELAGLKPE
jgi:tripartite-type tricarboxylate transporter receptor subunit TctC